jgi:hypothetical protein
LLESFREAKSLPAGLMTPEVLEDFPREEEPNAVITYNAIYLLAVSEEAKSRRFSEMARVKKMHAKTLRHVAATVVRAWPVGTGTAEAVGVIEKEFSWLVYLCGKLREPDAGRVYTGGDVGAAYALIIAPIIDVMERRRGDFQLTPKVPDATTFFKTRMYLDNPNSWIVARPAALSWPKKSRGSAHIKDSPF